MQIEGHSQELKELLWWLLTAEARMESLSRRAHSVGMDVDPLISALVPDNGTNIFNVKGVLMGTTGDHVNEVLMRLADQEITDGETIFNEIKRELREQENR